MHDRLPPMKVNLVFESKNTNKMCNNAEVKLTDGNILLEDEQPQRTPVEGITISPASIRLRLGPRFQHCDSTP